jgi:hypothetical protein
VSAARGAGSGGGRAHAFAAQRGGEQPEDVAAPGRLEHLGRLLDQLGALARLLRLLGLLGARLARLLLQRPHARAERLHLLARLPQLLALPRELVLSRREHLAQLAPPRRRLAVEAAVHHVPPGG